MRQIPGLYLSEGDRLTPIAETTQTFAYLGQAFINNRGTVVFSAQRGAGPEGLSAPETIFLYRDGVVRPSVSEPHIEGSAAGLNQADTIVCLGTMPGGVHIFTIRNGQATAIVRNTGRLFSGFGLPTINDLGTVAFSAGLGPVIPTGSGLYTSTGGELTLVADSKDEVFSDFSNPAINNRGAVAFWSHLFDGRQGIFTGLNPVTDTVIATGDPLFGSTVRELWFLRGLNNAGQVAFYFELADRRAGIARADPVLSLRA